MSAIGVTRVLRRRIQALILVASVAAAGVALVIPVGAAQGTVHVTAEPSELSAQGGRSQIIVQIPATAASGETHVTLTTDLGAFTADSGPQRLDAQLRESSTPGYLRASAVLVGDGRAGLSVVTARVGDLVDTVTVRFIGPPAQLMQRAPTADYPLDSLRTHQVSVEVRDVNDDAVANAAVVFRIVQAAAGAELRSGARAEPEQMTVTSSSNGIASVSLSGRPGTVRLRASSGSASLEIRLELHGEPSSLGLIGFDGETLEVGKVGSVGSLQALLVDRSGRSAPNQRIRFDTGSSGLRVVADGEGESFLTDGSGRARVHLDATDAQLGTHTITARWSRGGVTLTDTIDVVVAGRPAALYLTATALVGDITDPLSEYLSSVSRYRIQAHVVDAAGQAVAGSWEIRWRPLDATLRALATPEVSATRNGIASSTFTLHHDGTGPDLTSIGAQAWLIAAAQVNSDGAIADLITEGLPLRNGWNAVTWRGGAIKASEALSPIRHAATAIWRRSPTGSWEVWFTEAVPGATDFELANGDQIFIVLHSAARLPNIER